MVTCVRHESSKSTRAVKSFQAIPLPSCIVPTIHLHIKQGSHLHALANDFRMSLSLHITTAFKNSAVLQIAGVTVPLSPLAMFYSRCGLAASLLESLVSLEFWPNTTESKQSPQCVTGVSYLPNLRVSYKEKGPEDNGAHLSKQI